MQCKWFTYHTNRCSHFSHSEKLIRFYCLHVSHWGQAVHQNIFYVGSLPSLNAPISLCLAFLPVSPPLAPLGIILLLLQMPPHSVCVCWPLLCLSVFIFDAFSMSAAGRGDGSSMPRPALSDLHSSLSLPLAFCCFFSHLNFILFTTSDNTPVSFSFVLVSFPLTTFFTHLFPPSMPPCNWRIFLY